MPVAIKGTKERAKLLKALDRSGAHFIALGSGSSASSDDEVDSSVGREEEKAPLSATAEGEAAPGMNRAAAILGLYSSPLSTLQESWPSISL